MKTIKKHIITSALLGWALISLLVIAGAMDAESISSVLIGILGGAISLLLACRSIGWADRKGWLIEDSLEPISEDEFKY